MLRTVEKECMPVEVLGIDFGTSNTVAVLAGGGRPPRNLSIDGSAWMPSAVYVDDDDSLAVGRDAERKARLAPERFEPNPKRRIDDGEILLGVRVVPVVDAIAAVLRRVGEEARRQLNGRNPDQVHLTHPAQWGSARQNVLLAAARAAGLGGAVSLLPEPVAAAAHFASLPGNALPPGSALAVYDLGGGTFDCAVVGATPTGYTVLAEAGLPDVGGVDFDQTIVDHLGRTAAAVDPGRWQSLTRPRTAGDRRAARALREDVRAAKETLSRYSQTDLPLPEPFEDTLLTRREFDGLIRPAIVRTVELLAATVERAGLTPQRLAGIYFVGGSSRIPLVAAVISEKLGVVASTLDQPETSVAMGAALSSGSSRTPGRTEALGPTSGPRPPVPGPAGPHQPGGAPIGGPAPVPAGPVSAPQRPVTGPPVTATSLGSVTGVHPGSAAGVHSGSAAGVHSGSATVVHPGSVTGPQPGSVTGMHPGSVTGPRPMQPTGPRPPVGPPTGPGSGAEVAGRSGGGRNRLLVIGAIAAVVVIAVVTAVIILTTGGNTAGPDNPTSTSTTGGSSGVSTSSSVSTAPNVPTVPSECADSPIDDNGMTPCMAALAGPNVSRAIACSNVPADNASLQSVLGSVSPLAVSGCTDLDGGKVGVVYIQFHSTDDAIQSIDAIAQALPADPKSWNHGNGSGRVMTAEDSEGSPQIYWSYSGVPVIAFATQSDSSSGITMDELNSFWEDSLLPQS
jgi:actin-like ATPase involved in cell morphogenesis